MMTKEKLLAELRELRELRPEVAHVKADNLLIEYIGDLDIKLAYGSIRKWYS